MQRILSGSDTNMPTSRSEKFIPFMQERDSCGRLLPKTPGQQKKKNSAERQSSRNTLHRFAKEDTKYAIQSQLITPRTGYGTSLTSLRKGSLVSVLSPTASPSMLRLSLDMDDFDSIRSPESYYPQEENEEEEEEEAQREDIKANDLIVRGRQNENINRLQSTPNIFYQTFKVNSVTVQSRNSENQKQQTIFQRNSGTPASKSIGNYSFKALSREDREKRGGGWYKSSIHLHNPCLGQYQSERGEHLIGNAANARPRNVFILGKGKNLFDIPQKMTLQQQKMILERENMHKVVYSQVERRAPIADFAKTLSRVQLNQIQLWAPSIYDQEKLMIRERNLEFGKLDNEAIEKECQFFMLMNKKYPQVIPKQKIILRSIEDPVRQPLTKQAIKEKNRKLLKQFGFNTADRQFDYLKEKWQTVVVNSNVQQQQQQQQKFDEAQQPSATANS